MDKKYRYYYLYCWDDEAYIITVIQHPDKYYTLEDNTTRILISCPEYLYTDKNAAMAERDRINNLYTKFYVRPRLPAYIMAKYSSRLKEVEQEIATRTAFFDLTFVTFGKNIRIDINDDFATPFLLSLDNDSDEAWQETVNNVVEYLVRGDRSKAMNLAKILDAMNLSELVETNLSIITVLNEYLYEGAATAMNLQHPERYTVISITRAAKIRDPRPLTKQDIVIEVI